MESHRSSGVCWGALRRFLFFLITAGTQRSPMNSSAEKLAIDDAEGVEGATPLQSSLEKNELVKDLINWLPARLSILTIFMYFK